MARNPYTIKHCNQCGELLTATEIWAYENTCEQCERRFQEMIENERQEELDKINSAKESIDKREGYLHETKFAVGDTIYFYHKNSNTFHKAEIQGIYIEVFPEGSSPKIQYAIDSSSPKNMHVAQEEVFTTIMECYKNAISPIFIKMKEFKQKLGVRNWV